MLLTMHIKNIALIEEIDIDFHEQLNICLLYTSDAADE